MELNLSKEWYEKHVENEGDYDIGAGLPSMCSFFQISDTDKKSQDIEENKLDGYEHGQKS